MTSGNREDDLHQQHYINKTMRQKGGEGYYPMVIARHFLETVTSCHALYFEHLFQNNHVNKTAVPAFASLRLFPDHKGIVLFRIRRPGRIRCLHAACFRRSHRYDQYDLPRFQDCIAFLLVWTFPWSSLALSSMHLMRRQ